MHNDEAAIGPADAVLARTPPQILGPFFPLGKTPSDSPDLTRVPGRTERAGGQILYISGRILDMHGQPVPDAKITVWQANHHGRYDHPNDENPAPHDPNFGGYTVIRSDQEGRYRIKTIKPGAYPTGPTAMRPSHVHFEIESKRERLLTQMYFEGDLYQKEDRWLQSVRDPNTLIAKISPPAPDMEPDAVWARFDFVLTYG